MTRMSAELEGYIEDFADAVCESGLPVLAGRALGYLLVCDPACQTAAEVATALGETERETAMMIWSLEQAGMLDCVTLPDQDAPCFSVRPIDQMLKTPLKRAASMRRVADQGVSVAQGDEARARLREMADFYGFMEQELGQLVERWRAARRKQSGASRS